MKWRSVRQPPAGGWSNAGWVLVARCGVRCGAGPGWMAVMAMWSREIGDFVDYSGAWVECVTHWMPLPPWPKATRTNRR